MDRVDLGAERVYGRKSAAPATDPRQDRHTAAPRVDVLQAWQRERRSLRELHCSEFAASDGHSVPRGWAPLRPAGPVGRGRARQAGRGQPAPRLAASPRRAGRLIQAASESCVMVKFRTSENLRGKAGPTAIRAGEARPSV